MGGEFTNPPTWDSIGLTHGHLIRLARGGPREGQLILAIRGVTWRFA